MGGFWFKKIMKLNSRFSFCIVVSQSINKGIPYGKYEKYKRRWKNEGENDV